MNNGITDSADYSIILLFNYSVTQLFSYSITQLLLC